MTSEGKPRVVVLLSGGMDSCVCAALAARDGDAAAVHISYGQRTEARERQSFLAICERLGIHHRLIVRNEALRAIGGSALTDSNIAVPESHAIGHDVPVTRIPAAHLLSQPTCGTIRYWEGSPIWRPGAVQGHAFQRGVRLTA